MADADRLALMARLYAEELAPKGRAARDRRLWELTSRPEPARDVALAMEKLTGDRRVCGRFLRQRQAPIAKALSAVRRPQFYTGARRNVDLSARAVMLRAERLTYREIGEVLGISTMSAAGYVQRAILGGGA